MNKHDNKARVERSLSSNDGESDLDDMTISELREWYFQLLGEKVEIEVKLKNLEVTMEQIVNKLGVKVFPLGTDSPPKAEQS